MQKTPACDYEIARIVVNVDTRRPRLIVNQESLRRLDQLVEERDSFARRLASESVDRTALIAEVRELRNEIAELRRKMRR